MKAKGLNQFTKDVLYGAVVSITSGALLGAGGSLLALMALLIFTGGSVPAWLLFAMAAAAVATIYLIRRAVRREARELERKGDDAEAALDRHESYGENLCSVMDAFQRVLAGDIKRITIPQFLERGILEPARDVMRANGHADDVRLSVLIANDGKFRMGWAAGHSVEGQQKYQRPISSTLSRVAFEKKLPQSWKNVKTAREFERTPEASRDFTSMVSVPILVGDKPAGVFNVVTDREDAFDAADINYITSLGSVVQVAVGVALKERQEQERRNRPANMLPPGRPVASARRPRRKEEEPNA